jgi:competence protein ComGC
LHACSGMRMYACKQVSMHRYMHACVRIDRRRLIRARRAHAEYALVSMLVLVLVLALLMLVLVLLSAPGKACGWSHGYHVPTRPLFSTCVRPCVRPCACACACPCQCPWHVLAYAFMRAHGTYADRKPCASAHSTHALETIAHVAHLHTHTPSISTCISNGMCTHTSCTHPRHTHVHGARPALRLVLPGSARICSVGMHITLLSHLHILPCLRPCNRAR